MENFVFMFEPSSQPPSEGRSQTSPIKAVQEAISAEGGQVDTLYALDGTSKVLAIATLDPDAATKVIVGLRRHYGLTSTVWRGIPSDRFEQIWNASATPARSAR